MNAFRHNANEISERVEREVQETLRCFNEEPPRKASPDFYARVWRKIRSQAPELPVSPPPQNR